MPLCINQALWRQIKLCVFWLEWRNSSVLHRSLNSPPLGWTGTQFAASPSLSSITVLWLYCSVSYSAKKWSWAEYPQTRFLASAHTFWRMNWFQTWLCSPRDMPALCSHRSERPLTWSRADLDAVNQAVICTDTKMLLLNLLLGIDRLRLNGKCRSASRRFDNDQRRLWDTALLQEQSSRRTLKRSGREHWQQKAEMLGNHKKVAAKYGGCWVRRGPACWNTVLARLSDSTMLTLQTRTRGWVCACLLLCIKAFVFSFLCCT